MEGVSVYGLHERFDEAYASRMRAAGVRFKSMEDARWRRAAEIFWKRVMTVAVPDLRAGHLNVHLVGSGDTDENVPTTAKEAIAAGAPAAVWREGPEDELVNIFADTTALGLASETADETWPLVRGALYHEMGHVLFTPSTAYGDGNLSRLPATVIGERGGMVSVPGWPEVERTANYVLASAGHTLWNILEDVRMERLLVAKFPGVKPYLDLIISRVITDEFRKGRRKIDGLPSLITLYVLTNRRVAWSDTATRDEITKTVTAEVGAEVVAKVDWIVDNVLNSKDPDTDTWIGAALLYYLIKGNGEDVFALKVMDETMGKGARASSDEAAADATAEALDAIDETGEPGDIVSAGSASDDADADGDGDEGSGGTDGDGGDTGEANDADDSKGNGAGAGADDSTDFDMNKWINKLRSNANKRAAANEKRTVDEVADETKRDLEAVDDLSRTERIVTHPVGGWAFRAYDGDGRTPAVTPRGRLAAEDLSREIAKAVEDLDAWVETKRDSGRFNLDDWINADYGDFDVFDEFHPSGEEDTAAEIVVLIDNSGSMAGEEIRAATEAGWVLAKAAERHPHIDLSLGWFNSYGGWISVAEGGVETVPESPKALPAYGGTEPTPIIRDAESILATSDRSRRLLVVLTDGAWHHPHDVVTADDVIESMNARGIDTMLLMLSSGWGNIDLTHTAWNHNARFVKEIKDPADVVTAVKTWIEVNALAMGAVA